MNTTADERKVNNSAQKEKILNILKNILIYAGVIIVGAFLLAVLYQVLKFLFVAAVLFIAWIWPRRWR